MYLTKQFIHSILSFKPAICISLNEIEGIYYSNKDFGIYFTHFEMELLRILGMCK